MVPYRVIRSSRKTVAVQVARDGEVTVRAPLFASDAQIAAFAASREDWIKRAVQRQKALPDVSKISAEQLAELKRRAAEVIPAKVEHYSRLMGLTPTAVRLNTAKTRFGSCSGKNSLNFSAFLMLYPDEAIDYVVVHELAHIRHHNHGKAFYRLIERYLPDYRRRIQLLKEPVMIEKRTD